MKKTFNPDRTLVLLSCIIITSLFLFSYAILHYEQIITDSKQIRLNLERELFNTKTDNETLSQILQAKEEEVRQLANQVNEIAGTVGNLEKLNRLDPQLLQKYSKVYFLNENYIPVEFTEIDNNYLWNKERKEQILSAVWPYLQRLLKDAKSDGKNLDVLSSYRSFQEQGGLKSAYVVSYGSGANKFSADQGYSEHQLGTTVDFTTDKVEDTFSGFSKTSEYEWLLSNAYKYGFVISYPKENTYYQFEPWHWRFVGVDLARRLRNEGKYFYDMDQREIDSYLIRIFD